MIDFELTDRETAQIRACLAYYENHADSGLVGHGAFMLVAKLWKRLEELSRAWILREYERQAFVSFIHENTGLDENEIEKIIRQGLRNALEKHGTTDVEESS